ncbi:MAG TPA: choice-of-anchor V domain-containing protein [Candidatus Sulfopaludibacter sp.]|jgi:uncharacterized protein (TIGR03437 family)|nr:choice-of-anchor V domain-containing protein [Candidatus Sulfopaludibacter sp.]
MMRTTRLRLAKAAVVMGTVPILLWAYEYGPDPGHVGIPTENGGATCATSGCHTGTANDPNNKGSVTVSFPSGLTYTPGVTQQLSVTVADPATTQQAYGFQLTARVAGKDATMAGSFAYIDNNTLLMCSLPGLQNFRGLCNTPGIQGCSLAGTTCPTGMTLQYMEHSYTGYFSSLQPPHNGSYTYNFNWTPPATNVGNVTIYVAGNAGRGGAPTQDGDHIYTNKYTLTPAAATGVIAGTITGVSNNASGQAGIAPAGWVTIYGSDFTSPGFTDDWSKSIVNGKLPTALDGVTVSIGGKPAYVYFISPGQINVQAPDVSPGPVAVTVTNGAGVSAAFNATVLQTQPALYQYLPTKYAIATRYPDNAFIGNPSSIAGTVSAKAGDILILWCTGLGTVNPAVPAGIVPNVSAPAVTGTLTVTVGSTVIQPIYAVLSPYAGLYQVAVQLPNSLPTGDVPIQLTQGSAQSPATVFLNVK